MSERGGEYWREVARGLRHDGPAPIPPDLAARAFAAAMDAARVREPTLLETLVRLARPVTAAAAVCAVVLLLVGLSAGRAEGAREAATASLYQELVGPPSSSGGLLLLGAGGAR